MLIFISSWISRNILHHYSHTRTIKLPSNSFANTFFYWLFYRKRVFLSFLPSKYEDFASQIFFCGSAIQLTCHRFESFIMTKSLWITFVGKSLYARMRSCLSNRRKIPNAGKSSKRIFFEGKIFLSWGYHMVCKYRKKNV